MCLVFPFSNIYIYMRGSLNDNLTVCDFTLTMLTRGEPDPTVYDLDMSPIILFPVSVQRHKRQASSKENLKRRLITRDDGM